MPRFDVAAVKHQARLAEIAAGKLTIDQRRSRRGEVWAICPFHAEETASLHIFRDRKSGEDRFKCFGCGAGGDAIQFLMQLENVSFVEAVKILGGEELRAPPADDARAARQAASAEARERAAEMSALRQLEKAKVIWERAAGDDPLLDAYLAARGVDIAALRSGFAGKLPPALRFVPDLACWGEAGVIHRGPAMVAKIVRGGNSAGEMIGIHRTWIMAEGRAKLATGEKVPKQWLGLTGRMAGGAIVFGPATERMIVGEGIESVLVPFSRQIAMGLAAPLRRGGWSAQAALSLGNLAGAGQEKFGGPASPATGKPLPSAVPDWSRPGWRAPDTVEHLVILGEGSAKDPLAAKRFTERARRRHSVKSNGRTRASCRVWVAGGDYALGLDHADLGAGADAHLEETK